MSSRFAEDISSVGCGAGVREVRITDRWNTPFGRPNGGYVLATMLRGICDELDVSTPLAASISYLRGAEPGVRAELKVETLHSGRRVQTAQALLSQRGRPVAQLVANFADRSGSTHDRTLIPAPVLADPEDCADPLDHGLPTDGIFGQVEYRLTEFPGWAKGEPSGDPRATLWQRLGDTPLTRWEALALLCDSFAPVALELGLTGSATVQLTVTFVALPESDWIATRLTTHQLTGGFHDEECELWDRSGTLLAQSRQIAVDLS